jgi:aryl-alcohol dehydrogenase
VWQVGRSFARKELSKNEGGADMEILAAVVHHADDDFQIEPVTLAEPRAEEVLVRIVACGVCHTDIHVQHQHYAFPFPAVLGHEGAGIVERVGPGVTRVSPGDPVLLGYAYCGRCLPCLDGRPFACQGFYELNFGGRLADGTTRLQQNGRELSVFFGQSSFATHAVVHVNNLVKVDKGLDLRVLAPLGCGVQTGAGTVLNVFAPDPGASVAVLGAGAVGLSAVMAARLAGCGVIIAADIHAHRLQLARELGATHAFHARQVDVVDEIRRLGGVQYAVEASGKAEVGHQAAAALQPGGHLAYVSECPALDGLDPSHTATLTISEVVEGDSIPQVFIPQLIDWYLAGEFPLQHVIRFYPWQEINQAVHDALTGETIKPVLVMPEL